MDRSESHAPEQEMRKAVSEDRQRIEGYLARVGELDGIDISPDQVSDFLRQEAEQNGFTPDNEGFFPIEFYADSIIDRKNLGERFLESVTATGFKTRESIFSAPESGNKDVGFVPEAESRKSLTEGLERLKEIFENVKGKFIGVVSASNSGGKYEAPQFGDIISLENDGIDKVISNLVLAEHLRETGSTGMYIKPIFDDEVTYMGQVGSENMDDRNEEVYLGDKLICNYVISIVDSGNRRIQKYYIGGKPVSFEDIITYSKTLERYLEAHKKKMGISYASESASSLDKHSVFGRILPEDIQSKVDEAVKIRAARDLKVGNMTLEELMEEQDIEDAEK